MKSLVTNIYFISIQCILQLLILSTTIMILIKLQVEDFTVKSDPIYEHFSGNQMFSNTNFMSIYNKNETEIDKKINYGQKPNIWIKTWVEYYLVWQISSSFLSIITIFLKIIFLKLNQPLFIIPNIVSLFIDILINLLGFSVFLACILRIPRYIRFSFSVEILMIYQMAFLLSSACINFISLGVTKKLYMSLKNDSNNHLQENVY
uniref:Transmembrane protein n=1 Tax=Strongyloides papillosus TaxID=174720 RepID=A0A0N5C0H1_STREA